MSSHSSNPVIDLQSVTRHFGATLAVDGVSLSVGRGRLLALLGPSGCGKTTTLRLIAGLEQPDTGAIRLDGAVVAGRGAWVPPERRRVGLVFQDFALFPHLTVAENIAFALKRSHEPVARSKRVGEMLDLVGLIGLEKRLPHQLSGGQQQRVALARALAFAPAVVLLDEPFSNLDAALRKSMRADVRRILKQAGATALLVTHDQEEALSLADEVAVMEAGRIAQIGAPQEIYLRPATRAVASFVGDANLLPGWAHGDTATCALGQLPLAVPAHGAVSVLVRPEQIALAPGHNGEAGRVERLQFFGHDQLAEIRVSPDLSIHARTWPEDPLAPGARVRWTVQGPVVAYPAESPGIPVI